MKGVKRGESPRVYPPAGPGWYRYRPGYRRDNGGAGDKRLEACQILFFPAGGTLDLYGQTTVLGLDKVLF
jgi:hypothetical protein